MSRISDIAKAYKELHGENNITGNFYYDETNNFRKLKLTDKGLNNDIEKSNFVLGGLCSIDGVSNIDTTSLLENLKKQKKMTEYKFTYFSYKQTSFEDLLNSKRLNKFMNWVKECKIVIHFTIVNYLYYSLADIIDSFDIEEVRDPIQGRLLKNELYKVVIDNIDSYLKLFYKYQYPNIKKEEVSKFSREFYQLYQQSIKPTKNESKKLLDQLIKSLSSSKEIIFLHDNEDNILFKEYAMIYLSTALIAPNANHIYDNEVEIQKKLKEFEPNIENIIPISFCDSKSDIMIQLSDALVGFIGKLTCFIDWLSKEQLEDFVIRLDEIQKDTLSKFYEIVQFSESFNRYTTNYIGPNTFLDKQYFLISLLLK
jgi:hypothetical protein